MCIFILTRLLDPYLEMGLNVPAGFFLLGERDDLVLWPGNPAFVTMMQASKWSQALMKGASKFSWSLGRKSSFICLYKSKSQCQISELFGTERYLDLKNKDPKEERRSWCYQNCSDVMRGNLRSVQQDQGVGENIFNVIV